MPNMSQVLWPIKYWKNKKRQFMAGGIGGGRNVWVAFGMGLLAILFAFTATVGILTARPHEQAQHIPLRPIPEEQLFLASVPTSREPSAIVNKVATSHPVTPSAPVSARPDTWPLAGASIEHDFGWQKHPVLKDWRYHTGVDLTAAAGQPVVAALAGQVIAVRSDSKTGLTVVVTSTPWSVYHGSLAVATVKPGDTVTAGQTIGTVGTSFQEPYPHLHLAIEKNGQYVDPSEVLPAR
jgi:murein DD-endopeptidase MepM/ murein hydrolase activator NlpD